MTGGMASEASNEPVKTESLSTKKEKAGNLNTNRNYFANEHNFLGLEWKSVLHPKTQKSNRGNGLL